MVTGLKLGLTARDMSDMGRLAQLAANPQGTTREEIYLAVASLYRIQGTYLNERERALMQDILRLLARDVEMAIRIALAERLADDTTAPHDLILMLADDRIEVARPVILRSPLLTDADVLKMVAESGEGHQEAVAHRPNITEPVTDALVQLETPSVLAALVRNVTARISAAAFETLVEKSRHIEDLQGPLAHREDLPGPLASRMCEWVSDALKAHITQNYRIAPETLTAALGHAQHAVESKPAAPKVNPSEGSAKLIDKLAASNQLKAGFLLRVLHQGQIDLFDLAFARLLSLPLEDARHRLYEMGPRGLALCCRAVGIDRAVFATVFNLSRQARSIRPVLTGPERLDVEAVFNGFTKQAALMRLQSP